MSGCNKDNMRFRDPSDWTNFRVSRQVRQWLSL